MSVSTQKVLAQHAHPIGPVRVGLGVMLMLVVQVKRVGSPSLSSMGCVKAGVCAVKQSALSWNKKIFSHGPFSMRVLLG